MADNVAITAGSGTNIATDEITGTLEHAQIIKLAIAADGSRTLIPADGTDGLLVNLGANNDVSVASIAAGDNNIGNVDIVTVPAPLSTTGGGTEATALRVTVATDSTGVLSVDDNGASLTVDNGGTFATQIDGAALTALQLIDNPVLVDDTAFTPASSSVTMAGFVLDDTATGSVAEGDGGAARMTADRRQIVQLGESGAKDVVGGGSKTDTTDQSIMAALASNFNYLCWLTVYNASATNTFATLKDGATTRAIIPLPAFGGAVLNWPRGLRSTSNTAWNVAAGASVTTAYFYGGGFTATS